MNDDPAVNFEVSSLFGTVVASFRKTEFDKVTKLDRITWVCTSGGELLGMPPFRKMYVF